MSKKSLEEIGASAIKALWIGTWSKVAMFSLVIIASAYSFIKSDTDETDHIAEIEISGTIGAAGDNSEGMKIASNILKAIKDPHAKAIILMANSPGGAPADSQIIYDLIRDYHKHFPVDKDEMLQIKHYLQDDTVKFATENNTQALVHNNKAGKPIIAVVKDLCASACVQSVIGADILTVQQASLFGNIGVKIEVYNWSNFAEKLGITQTTVKSGVHKDLLNSWVPLPPEQLEMAKTQMVMPVFEQFKSDVLTARPAVKQIGDSLFNGDIWTGDNATKLGLTDYTITPLQAEQSLEYAYNLKIKSYTAHRIRLGNIFEQFSSAILAKLSGDFQ